MHSRTPILKIPFENEVIYVESQQSEAAIKQQINSEAGLGWGEVLAKQFNLGPRKLQLDDFEFV